MSGDIQAQAILRSFAGARTDREMGVDDEDEDMKRRQRAFIRELKLAEVLWEEWRTADFGVLGGSGLGYFHKGVA